MKETRNTFLSIVKKVLSSRRQVQEQEENEVVLRRESSRKYFLQKTSSLPLYTNSSYNSNISYNSDSSYNRNYNSNISYNSSYKSNSSYNSGDVFDVNLSSHGPEEHHHQCTGRRHQSVKLRPSLSSQQVNMVTPPHQYFASSSHSNLTGTSSKAHRKLSLKLTKSRNESITHLPHVNTENLPETSKKASRKLSRKHLMRTQAECHDQLSDLSTTNHSESVQKAPRKLSIKRLRLHRSRAGSSERLSELTETESPSDPDLDLAPAAVDAVDDHTVRMFPSSDPSDLEFV